MVVERVVGVLDTHHPGAEQEPQNRADSLTDGWDPQQDEKPNGFWQVVFQFDPLTVHDSWKIFHHTSDTGIRCFLPCQFRLEDVRQAGH